ncbi:helix-turn-helix domain-containing protein [Luteithermobacter gelatinilyticus]|uniref:helix-turn-helix domain-containing protein n=1 Tax=Luteithermobacter gelatinilyticus TaxID=2582913 RepID=UPI00143DBBAE|nr:AraC family transcriptional regulator [Luteithermobacter gelatinilyticus]
MGAEHQPAAEPTAELTVDFADIAPLLDMNRDSFTSPTLRKYSRLLKTRDPASVSPIPLVDYFHMLRELSVDLNDETIHLSSRHLMPGSTGYILSRLTGCETLGEAMRLIAKTYNMLHGGPYNRVEERDGNLFYLIDDSNFPYMTDNRDYIYFTLECVLIFLHGMLSLISGEQIMRALRKVYSKRERGLLKSRHMAFWDVPVRYQSAAYALIYDLSVADLPVRLPAPPPTMADIYYSVTDMIAARAAVPLRRGNVTAQVREVLERGIYAQPQVARQLGFSVATLRRRLQEENSSFRALSHDVLNKKACQMLAQGYHVTVVAEDLGFAEFRSFIRAFKGWNGMTPAAYVKALRTAPRKN